MALPANPPSPPLCAACCKGPPPAELRVVPGLYWHRLTEDAVVAVTGADLPPQVDGEAREPWTSFAVKAGQRLTFGPLRDGARVYIAVAGGLDTPPAPTPGRHHPPVRPRAKRQGHRKPRGAARNDRAPFRPPAIRPWSRLFEIGTADAVRFRT
ncbi:hypothetical protein [Roseospira goensis]|uniref:Carboxyltransferase domain-containing protein n=1 Tax=Roseospira goensis TaxID=391922 RepID=A0A7W6RZ29_9PROT|nr:hypothetical protein [Roseospira goensis]MBB4285890.1 hypothetical protein [Roseospira goensis]